MASVVVIGAGIGGLAVAARLAAQGHDVTVLEQSHRVGGALETYRRDGFAFDTGPALLTLPAVYRDLFLKTAVRRRDAALEDNVDLRGLDSAFGYRWADDATATQPGSNSNRVAAAFGDALGGSAASDWQRFTRRGADLWSLIRVPYLESPVAGARDLRRLLRPAALRTLAPWQSLRGVSRRYLRDPRLVMVVDRYATDVGVDPRRAPAALAAMPFVEQTFGAWHIGGGVGTLADALHRRCVERGVRFRFDTAVTRVATSGARASGVRLAGGGGVDADVVVADIDAASVYGRLLDHSATRSQLRRARRSGPTMATFSILLALQGRTAGLQHHTVLFPADGDAALDAIVRRAAPLASEPTVRLCRPDDPGMNPPGHEALAVHVPASSDDPDAGVDWRDCATVDRYTHQVLDVMAQRGVDVRDRVRWLEVRTPADRATGTGSAGGLGPRRVPRLRPVNRSPVAGMFLVGGSAHPGPGLPWVGMSAAIVAELIGSA